VAKLSRLYAEVLDHYVRACPTAAMLDVVGLGGC
jgi:hypothetical protein